MKRHYHWLYLLAGFIGGGLLFPLINLLQHDLNSLLESLVPEAISILFTIIFIDRIYQYREDQRQKRHLLQQLGSRINSIAISAAESLWANEWWTDGTLRAAQLERADLRGVDFGKANLTGSRLSHPRYGNARFDETSILPDETHWTPHVDIQKFTDPHHPHYWRGFGLRRANLKKANFEGANLRGADMRECDLTEANLRGADLRGASLEQAILRDATLKDALFDEQTILPDNKNWNPTIRWSIYDAKE